MTVRQATTRSMWVRRRGSTPPGACRSAFTLVELVLSSAVAAIIMTGLASAVVLASRALPDEDRPSDKIIQQAQVAEQILTDLQYARFVVERGSRAMTFVVADRDGDGAAERIRYAWSGTAGDPLTWEYNGGGEIPILDDVHVFGLAWDTRTATEQYAGAPVEAAETLFSSYPAVQDSWGSFTITSDRWPGQYFEPSLPEATVSWRISRVLVSAIRDGGADAQIAVQMRLADADKKPTNTVVAEKIINESLFPAWPYEWREAAFANSVGVTPGARLCLVLKHASGGNAGQILCETADGWGAINTTNGGSSWNFYDDISRLHYIYGHYSTPGPDSTALREYVTAVRLALQAGSDSQTALDTSAHLLDAPELVSGVWQADFNVAPTLTDYDANGVLDWIRRDAGAFDDSSLDDGVWEADAILDTQPGNDFTELTTVEVRFRNTSVGGDGAVFWINADWSGGQVAPIIACLRLQANGLQTLSVYHKRNSSTRLLLTEIPTLMPEFVTLRLLIDPDVNTVNVRVNGVEIGTYLYNTIPQSNTDRFASVLASGSDAEFDYVTVRVGAD